MDPLDGVGWRATGDFKTVEKRQPFFPRIKHILHIIPMVFRFVFKSVRDWWLGNTAFINIFHQQPHDPYTGVPIGGIGCGSIGRDFRGGFKAFSLLPGVKELRVRNIKANQFILTVRSVTGQLLRQRLLTCARFSQRQLPAWNKMFSSSELRYRGLYPRAWSEFSLRELGLTLVCEQISPVIAHDYKDSSLPTCCFVWTVRNSSTVDYAVSITFAWRNGTGNRNWAAEVPCRTKFVDKRTVKGVELSHSIRGMPLTYGVFAKSNEGEQTISSTLFDPCSSGEALWRKLQEDGNFENISNHHLDGKHELGVAVCCEGSVLAESTAEYEFVLTWDMPEVRYSDRSPMYKRRYTRFFSGIGAASAIASHAVSQRADWQRRIEEWQAPVVQDRALPESYRSALFNELYFIADGSVSWLEFDGTEEEKLPAHTEKHLREWGRFGYMESWEYLMVNTYDVHFYSSQAFVSNWPQLELSIQHEFAEQLHCDDRREVLCLMDGGWMDVKTPGGIPHDLGHPMDNPFRSVNAYELHDTAKWKDLNLKFVLLALRDFDTCLRDQTSDATDVLAAFYARSTDILEMGRKIWDTDGDGMIENGGFADQTYDVWTMTGTSAYCGSLWLGALEAARRMAESLGRVDEADALERELKRATEALQKKLWNGRYFDFDETCATVMADQLCGVWFLAHHDGGLERALLPIEQIKSTLDVIFENNVRRFGSGKMGAVNGVTVYGKIDTSSIQSEEMWTGTAYALASFYALIGDKDRCFAIANGVYDECWRRSGLQFQTPEAIYEHRQYRAIGYMRPLAIWNVQHALEMLKKNNNNGSQ